MRKAYAKDICSGVLILIVTLFSTPLLAEECYPLQLGVWPSAQVVPKEKAVCGIRLNPLYVDNERMQGIDIGVVNRANSIQGLQVGVINWAPRYREINSWGLQIGLLENAGEQYLVDKFPNAAFTGIQIAGFANVSDITGVQVSLINFARKVNGVQIGLWFFPVPCNFAKDEVRGLQLSLTGNGTASLYGAQLGLINLAGDVYGFQGGALNFAFHSTEWKSEGVIHGVQAGVINYANEVRGVQIGVLNFSKKLQGVQIGLLNVVTSRYPDSGLFISPLINVGF
jgi:hypothetical protein